MKPNLILSWIIVLCGYTGGLVVAQSNLDVEISNIRNKKGQLCVGLFTDEASFKTGKMFWRMKYSKKNVVDGKFRIQIPIHPGRYGLSVLDDENMNAKMEYNMLGIPSEGFGFSNYYLKGLHKPTFSDFDFIIEKDETKTLIVRMKYL